MLAHALSPTLFSLLLNTNFEQKKRLGMEGWHDDVH